MKRDMMNAFVVVLSLILNWGISGTVIANSHGHGASQGHQIGESLKREVPEFEKLRAAIQGAQSPIELGNFKRIKGTGKLEAAKITDKEAALAGLNALGKMHDGLAKCAVKGDRSAKAANELIENFVKWLEKMASENKKDKVRDENVLQAYTKGLRDILDFRALTYAGDWSEENPKFEDELFGDVMKMAKSIVKDHSWMERSTPADPKLVEGIDAIRARAVEELGKKSEPVCSIKNSETAPPSGPSLAGNPSGGAPQASNGQPADPAKTEDGKPADGQPAADPEVPSTPSAGANNEIVSAGDGKSSGSTAIDQAKKDADAAKEEIGRLKTALNQVKNADEQARATAASGALAGLDPFLGLNPLFDQELLRQAIEAAGQQQGPNIRGGNSPTNSRENTGPQISPSVSTPGGGKGNQGMDPAMMAALAGMNQQPPLPMLPGQTSSNVQPQLVTLPTLATPPQQQQDTSAFSKAITEMSTKLSNTTDSIMAMMMQNQYMRPVANGLQSAYTRGAAMGTAAMNAIRGRFAQSTSSNGGPANLVGRAKPPSLLTR